MGLNNAEKMAEKVIKGGANTYGKVGRKEVKEALDWKKKGGFADTKVTNMQRADHFAGRFMGTLQADAMHEGRTVLGMMGSHAIRGAVGGAAIGGTASALQGGSFWDGAKQGAFNGAVGWTAYRTAMRGVGAKSLNPFAKQVDKQTGGVFSAANTMWRSSSTDGEVSKQALAILNNRQKEGLARSFMNQSKKKKA